MTHEQKPESAEFRTREAHIADLAFQISDWKSYDDNEDITLARAHAEEFEARGAAEQRRKDAEGAEPVAWLIEDRCKGDPRRAHTPDSAVTDKAHADKAARFNFKVSALYTRPANVAASAASFDWLVEDARKGASNAPPSARFDMLFGADEVSISEARERLKALGIESLYVTDDWEDATEGNELSRADVEALPPLHEDEQKAGWKLASAWDTEDGTVIRHYVRPLRTSDQDAANIATGADISAIIRAVCELPDRSSPEDQPDMMLVTPDELRLILETARPANVAALEARVKELEGALSYLKDEAPRFASFYPQSSDARNTFVLFAGKIADRAAAICEGGEHG